jgi:hypothetical protein
MIRKILISLTLIILLVDCTAQVYPFKSIPEKLRKNADAVIRTNQCVYTVKSPDHAIMKIKKAITILNEDGDYLRYLAVPYDKYSKVNYIRGLVFNEKGFLEKVMGYSDIIDMSAITGGSFYSDDRMKVIRFPLYRYPYTVEYEYEIEFSGLLSYPNFSFQDSYDISVEEAGIQYILPKDMNLRFYEVALKNGVDSAYLENKKIYTWQEKSLTAVLNVRFLATAYLPVLYTAPYNFEYGGVQGSMQSWKSLGDWVYAVNKDRDALPEKEIAKIKEISSGYSDQKDKIRAIYEYMQSRTRFVSIKIGIGGYQTATAESVSVNGFGDCKALSNYTKALLKSAGINSYLALVYAGELEEDINTEFVDVQFNHVILCVPQQKDTIWLECTSQTKPFNYLGSFTEGRHALLITPEGGKMVRTPESKKDENLIMTRGSFKLNSAGNSTGKVSTNYSGYYYSGASNKYSLLSEDEMKRSLYASIGFPDFTILSTGFNEKKSEKPEAEFNYELNIKGFCSSTGKELIFTPSFEKMDYLRKDTAILKVPVSAISIDSLTYNCPVNYSLSEVPQDISLKTDFGTYNYSIKSEVDKIHFYRRLELNEGLITENEYTAFRSFVNQIANSDHRMIILKRSSD